MQNLDSEVENLSAWRLSRVLARSQSPRFYLLICDSPAVAESLLATLAEQMSAQDVTLQRIDLYGGGEEWLWSKELTQAVLEPLLAEASAAPGSRDKMLVVDGTRALPHDDKAWAHLVEQMSEHSREILGRLTRPLLLCLPPHLVTGFPEVASELWSVQRVVAAGMSRFLPHGKAIAETLLDRKTRPDFGSLAEVMHRLPQDAASSLPEALEAIYTDAAEMVELLQKEKVAVAEEDLVEAVLWLAQEAYLQSLAERFLYSNFKGIEQLEKLIPLELDEIFVDLRVRYERGLGDEEEREAELRKRLDLREAHARERVEDRLTEPDLQPYSPPSIPEEPMRPGKAGSRPVPIDRVLEEPGSIVLLGGPGSGKTTLLKRLARSCALGPKAFRKRYPAMPWCLPVFLPIGIYEDRGDGRGLVEFLQERLLEIGGQVLLASFEHRWSSGECLVLLDGLDEVVGAEQRIARTRDVADLIRGAGTNRVLVTSRPVGYNVCRLPPPAEHVLLQPFERRDVETFVRQWHHAYHQTVHPASPDPERARVEAQALIDDIERNPRVASLATNPLMLTIIALIKQHNVILPERRVDLYDIVLNTLIRSWNKARTQDREPGDVGEELGLEETKKLWAAVAYWMHHEHSAGVCSRQELRAKLVEVLMDERQYTLGQSERTAESYLRSAAERSGLLEERGANVFAFMHQTFQEYLAAQNLWLRRPRAQSFDRVLEAARDPRWHEVVRLTAGFIGVIQQDDEMVTDLVAAIAHDDRDPLEPLLCNSLRLAASCLADDVRVKPSVAGKIVRLICDRIRNVPYDEVSRALSGSFEEMRTYEPDEPTAVALLGLREQGTWKTRQEAVRLLRRVAAKYPKVAEGLKDFLEDGDPDVRALAAFGLWQAGERSEAVVDAILDAATSDVGKTLELREAELAQALIARLEDGDTATRRNVAAALGTFGTEAEATPALLKLLDDEEASVRYRAVLALRSWEPQKRVALALVKLLEDQDNYVQRSVVSVLGRWGRQAEATATLLELLKSEDPFVRHSAAAVLGKWGPQAETMAELLRMLENKGPFVRHGAATVLGYWGSHAEEEGTPALLKLLGDKDAYVRYSSASILGNWGYREHGIPVLLDLLQDETPSIRYGAVTVLAAWGPLEGAVEALSDLLEDESAPVRYRAASTLGKWGHQARATPTLLQLLRVDYASIRTKSAIELGSWGPQEEARSTLLELMKDEEPFVRNCAALVLGKWDYQEDATPVLLSILNDTDPNVRMNAVEVLRNWRHEAQVVPALLKILQSGDPFVRMSALEELGKWSPQPELMPVLLEALDDEAAGVRRGAAEVLRNWGGSPDLVQAVVPTLLADSEPALAYLAKNDPTPPDPQTARLLAEAIEPRADASEFFRLRQGVVFSWLWKKSQVSSATRG